MIRLGIVGCGSVAQQYHMPAAMELPQFSLAGLSDVQAALLGKLASQYQIGQSVADYRELTELDAVLIASPHSLHYPMACHFLERGIHVLVEKPMVLTSVEATRGIELAAAHGCVFAVGVFRRYYPISSLVRRLLSSRWLGMLMSIDAEEGSVYDWELQSRFLLDRKLAGGGVLMDTGSHLLDRILWWMEGAEVGEVDCATDSLDAVEADAEIRFDLKWGGGTVAVKAAMSRIRTLRNTIQLNCEHGTIELGSNAPDGLWITDHRLGNASRVWMQCGAPEAEPPAPVLYFKHQLEDFSRAISQKIEPLNSAASNVPCVNLIERCYGQQRLSQPAWQAPYANRTGGRT